MIDDPLLRRLADAHPGHDVDPEPDEELLERTLATPRTVARRRRRPVSRRALMVAVTTLAVAGTASAAVVRIAVEASKPSRQVAFDAARYVDHGDAFDCSDMPSQAAAQAVLRLDPRDPNYFDADRDGVACPELPAPKDLKAVRSIVDAFHCRPGDQRSARCPQAWRPFSPGDYVVYLRSDTYDCDTFASQADAQAVLRFAPSDPNVLDGDRDGIACPKLPAPKDLMAVPRTPPS